MWRRAHGRLAAIVVLAGGLSSCMPPPTRSPSSQRVFAEEERTHRFDCGTPAMYAEADRQEANHSPAHWRATLVEWIQGSGLRCQIESGMRFGEIRVTVNREREVVADAPGTWRLTEADRACVEAAAGAAVQEATRLRHWKAAALDEPLTAYVALGKWPPLFPPSGFVTDWLAAMSAKESRRRFQAQLPAEVVLEDDGCLSLPRRAAFTTSLGHWLMTEKPFAALWQATVAGRQDGVLGGTGPGWDERRRAYWLDDRAVLVHHSAVEEAYRRTVGMNQKPAPDAARQQICLLPLGGALRRDIRSHIDQRGTCWAGDLGEILVHPRTEFPTGRRFKAVGVGRNRVCAIDDGGAVTCCGERLPEDPPPVAFSQVAVGDAFDCGLTADGGLRCWGRAPPIGTGVVPGSFQQVAINGAIVCAVRRDTRALECWSGKGAHVPAVMPDRGRAVAFMTDGPCALLENGGVFCAGSHQDVGRELGPFRTFAADHEHACGVLAASSRDIRCWRIQDDLLRRAAVRGPDRSVLPTGDDPAQVALSERDRCVLGRSGHVACWGEAGTRSWNGLYGALAAGAGRVCAVTLDGDVQCDHGWPL